MRVTSAFLADHVSIYDGKLCVLGGVWDWYQVDALPADRVLQLAVIVQTDEDDVGQTREVKAELGSPVGEPLTFQAFNVAVADQPRRPEHLSLAMHLHVPFAEPGRHVIVISVDGDGQAAIPFELLAPAAT